MYRGRQHRVHRDACGKVSAQRAVFIARRVYFALFFFDPGLDPGLVFYCGLNGLSAAATIINNTYT